MKARLLAVLLLTVAGLYGCTTTPTAETTAAGGEAAAGTDAAAGGATSAGAQPGAGGQFQGNALDNPESPLAKRVVYFPFDSSELAAADRDALVAHGKYLAANPNAQLTVEGHADERGTREYNLALGERRAQAVMSVLTLQGANKAQVKVVSYGEERPAAAGHDESAWRLNRRAELRYAGR